MLIRALCFAYAVASRLAYVLYVGRALRRGEGGGAAAFRRFRRRAAVVMNNDAAALVLLCIVTRATWQLPWSLPLSITLGAILAVLGLGTKLWAARTLGVDAYFWRNFFEPESAPDPVSHGPYRFISSPMYTVGYLQTYGLALIVRSWPGLIVAAFDQAAILIFYHVVEKPHFERLHGSRSS